MRNFIFLILPFILLGCSRNVLHEGQSLSNEIANINLLGEGQVSNCVFDGPRSILDTRYSYQSGNKSIVITAADKNIVDFVQIELNRYDVDSFTDVLIQVAEIEKYTKADNLSLSTFALNREWVKFSLSDGDIYAFWGNGADFALTQIDVNELLQCVNNLKSHIL